MQVAIPARVDPAHCARRRVESGRATVAGPSVELEIFLQLVPSEVLDVLGVDVGGFLEAQDASEPLPG